MRLSIVQSRKSGDAGKPGRMVAASHLSWWSRPSSWWNVAWLLVHPNRNWNAEASGVEGAQQIRDLIKDIIHFGKIRTELEESIIISLYKGKGVTLERGLKLLDQGGWELPTTTIAHWWLAVWLHAWMQHHRCHIHCTPVTTKIPCHQQDTVHGLCRSGCRTGCPWENLYAVDLVIISESLEELQEKLILWKINNEGKVFWSTRAKPRICYLGWGSMCFRSPAKTPMPCVSRASAQIPFSVLVVPVGSTRDAVESLALWSLILAPGVNGVLERPDQ